MADSSFSHLRIASLLPSATEIVCFLGRGSQLVARSHECDFPPLTVKKIPICTSSTVDLSRSSAQINLNVHQHLEKGVALYHVDWSLLQELKPDLILTQSHCRACSLHSEEIQQEVQNKLGQDTRVVDLSPQKLSDVWENIEFVGGILGVSQQAIERVQQLTGKIRDIYNEIKEISPKPRVAAIEWIDPLMSAGNWIPELIEVAGGEPLFSKVGKHSEWLTWEKLRAGNPDIIIVLACGFDVDRARAEMAPLTTRAGWYDLTAVQNNHVFLLDGNQFFNRPGPRLLESVEILAEIFHPEIFDFGHKLEGWQYWGFDRVE